MSQDLKEALKTAFKTLAVIYCALAVLFLAGRIVAGKLPAPYGKKIIPSEITPWLK